MALFCSEIILHFQNYLFKSNCPTREYGIIIWASRSSTALRNVNSNRSSLRWGQAGQSKSRSQMVAQLGLCTPVVRGKTEPKLKRIYENYLWKLFIKNIYENYLWKILMKTIYENYLWKIFMKTIYKTNLWKGLMKTIYERD